VTDAAVNAQQQGQELL